jgi:hypothetical protein
VDDLADALVFMMENYSGEELVNVGTGEDVTIRELCEMVREAVGCEGALLFDDSMPDGTPRKLLDVSRLRGMGWRPKFSLKQGLEKTYQWFMDNPPLGVYYFCIKFLSYSWNALQIICYYKLNMRPFGEIVTIAPRLTEWSCLNHHCVTPG